jgi:hypothetical protein
VSPRTLGFALCEQKIVELARLNDTWNKINQINSTHADNIDLQSTKPSKPQNYWFRSLWAEDCWVSEIVSKPNKKTQPMILMQPTYGYGWSALRRHVAFAQSSSELMWRLAQGFRKRYIWYNESIYLLLITVYSWLIRMRTVACNSLDKSGCIIPHHSQTTVFEPLGVERNAFVTFPKYVRATKLVLSLLLLLLLLFMFELINLI